MWPGRGECGGTACSQVVVAIKEGTACGQVVVVIKEGTACGHVVVAIKEGIACGQVMVVIKEGTACGQVVVAIKEETVCGGLIVVCVFVPSGDHVLERTVEHVTSPSSPLHLPFPPPSPLHWLIISPCISSLTYLHPSLPSSLPSASKYQVREY